MGYGVVLGMRQEARVVGAQAQRGGLGGLGEFVFLKSESNI